MTYDTWLGEGKFVEYLQLRRQLYFLIYASINHPLSIIYTRLTSGYRNPLGGYTDLCENIPEIVISTKNRILKPSRSILIIGFHFLIGTPSGRN